MKVMKSYRSCSATGVKTILNWFKLVFLTNAVIAAPDNMGMEFIVGFMDNDVIRGIDYEAELFISTASKTTVNVRVQIPLFDPSYDKMFSLKSEEVKQLSLAANTRMTGTSIDSKGILIEADQEIAVYGVNKQPYSNGAFLAFPTDVLGTEYYTVSWFPPTLKCQLMVVGINDSTSVNITLSQALGNESIQYNNQTYVKGDLIFLTINRFQTFQLQSSGDLTGTYVISSNPIAVFSGNKKTMIPSGKGRDHLVEQLPPIKTWGKRFATVTIPDRTVGDRWKFIASEDNTFVNITGNAYAQTFTISKGGHEEAEIPSGPDYYCYIQADKPILVMQFVESQQKDDSDPAMITIPPLEQYTSFVTFSTPNMSSGSYTNYFIFIVKDTDKNGMIIDGDIFPTTTIFHKIPGTGIVGGYVNVTDGAHTISNMSPSAKFIGYIYGRSNFESYGTIAATRLAPINSVCITSESVVGDGIDNDCDGLIDEEICTPDMTITDDDGDGKTDEDCASTIPVDGNWGPWSYSPCSVTCLPMGSNINGTQTRNRTCDAPNPLYGGELCKGLDGERVLDETENVSCSSHVECPVDGNWGPWSYSPCSVTCLPMRSNINGTQTRNRTCDAPNPLYGGELCKGLDGERVLDETENVSCSSHIECPVDGNWGPWSYSPCSVTCLPMGSNITGSRTRNRTCDAPNPLYGGELCKGLDGERVLDETENVSCSSHVECPVDGNWGPWSYSPCSVTCLPMGSNINGTQTRNRTCDAPNPLYGGELCKGLDGERVLDETENVSCSSHVECPEFGGQVLPQAVGIPIGTNYVWLFAVLYEADFGQDILKPEIPQLQTCMCQCSAVRSSNLKMSKEEIMETLREILAELKVEKTSTSSYKRKLISVDDKRMASRGIGAVGVVILVIVLSIFTGNDIVTLASFLYSKCKKKKETIVL